MRRDWDIIRNILNRLEDLPDTNSVIELANVPDDQGYEYSYHVELLIEACLVEGSIYHTHDRAPNLFRARRLTWSGHELLDAIRSDTVWNRTKSTFASNGIGMTLDLVKSIATEISLTLYNARGRYLI